MNEEGAKARESKGTTRQSQSRRGKASTARKETAKEGRRQMQSGMAGGG